MADRYMAFRARVVANDPNMGDTYIADTNDNSQLTGYGVREREWAEMKAHDMGLNFVEVDGQGVPLT